MAEKNYLDKTGELYTLVKLKNYMDSNLATQAALSSLSSAESILNSTQNSQLGSLSTQNSTQNSELASLSSSLSEQASEIESLAVAQSEAGGDVGSRLNSLSVENSTQSSEIASMSTSLSEIESNIASLSTAQSTVDSTQNVTLSSLTAENSTQSSSISSLTIENSTQTSELTSLSASASELADDVSDLGSELDAFTEIDDSSTTVSNTWSASKIQAVVSAISTLDFAIVSVLPTTDISTTTIYLVPKTTSQTNNVYDEYIYANNAWELIGDTQIDLSGYVLESDLVAITDSEIDTMFEIFE